MGGVFVPIVIEFGAKGADIAPSVPIKWSGTIGIIAGAVPLIIYAVKKDRFDRMDKDNKEAILGFAAASLATGISILVLEQLRKSSGYSFRESVPLYQPGAEGLTAPVGQIIKEI